MCGGFWRLAIFKNEDFEIGGCYKDHSGENRILKGKKSKDLANSPNVCKNFCYNYLYYELKMD